MPKKVGKYEIHKTLGEGTFGKVKRALNTETQEWVAIKVLDKEKIQKQNMGAQVKKEISIMKLVRHPHVVQLNEVLASRTKIFIVLELVTGGELFDKIVAEGRFKEKTARFYFQQLCVGTEYCHRQGVCHRDLKPENLLLDNQGNLKISDFGLSALYDQGGTDRATLLHTTCGTPNYVAPEVLADRGYDGASADTWSIGVILYVFLAGFLPFDEPTMAALFRKIQKADFTYPTWFAEDVKDLLNSILVVKPKQRWSITQIIEHPWWKKDGPYADIADVNATALQQPSTLPDQANLVKDEEEQGQEDSDSDEDMLPVANQEVAAQAGQDNAGNVVDNVDESAAQQAQGETLNKIIQNEDEKKSKKTFLYVSPKAVHEIMELIRNKFSSIEGFVEQQTYKEGSKLRAEFDLGRGRVKVKVSIKLANKQPILCLVVVKRAGGDLISFQKISEELDTIGDMLQQSPQ
mmetsp:Transcript_12305/g.14131  ORF Transcript_12305/g.14131 Transcript_12305/m.14131 type:complete len:463 (+) Transcript_12305:58-1446(+)